MYIYITDTYFGVITLELRMSRSSSVNSSKRSLANNSPHSGSSKNRHFPLSLINEFRTHDFDFNSDLSVQGQFCLMPPYNRELPQMPSHWQARTWEVYHYMCIIRIKI